MGPASSLGMGRDPESPQSISLPLRFLGRFRCPTRGFSFFRARRRSSAAEFPSSLTEIVAEGGAIALSAHKSVEGGGIEQELADRRHATVGHGEEQDSLVLVAACRAASFVNDDAVFRGEHADDLAGHPGGSRELTHKGQDAVATFVPSREATGPAELEDEVFSEQRGSRLDIA